MKVVSSGWTWHTLASTQHDLPNLSDIPSMSANYTCSFARTLFVKIRQNVFTYKCSWRRWPFQRGLRPMTEMEQIHKECEGVAPGIIIKLSSLYICLVFPIHVYSLQCGGLSWAVHDWLPGNSNLIVRVGQNCNFGSALLYLGRLFLE